MSSTELPSVNEIRPAVIRMSYRMEAQLRANEDKGGWSKCPSQFLFARLESNLKDLRHNLRHGNFTATQRDCADIANFAMMISENQYTLAPKGETND